MSERARFSHKDPDYERLETMALGLLSGYVLSVRRGDLTAALFAVKVKDHLSTWHPEAASIGRVAAGGEAGLRDTDREIGDRAASKQIGYFDGFVGDIEDGRYDEEMDEDAAEDDPSALHSRAEMYGMALLGTAMAGWVGEQGRNDPKAQIYWVTDDDPCSSCDLLSSQSPYTAETLPTTPAAGDTQCLSRCRCFLEVG
jgi:hypothetical protein